MSEHGHAHDDDALAHASHEGIAQYIYVFIALCLLTTASFLTYSDYWPWHEQPKIGWAFMMAVSCTKAMLVILFFMHVKYEASWKYVLTIPAAFMSIFLILALVPDIGLRGHWVSEERQLYMAEPRGTRKPMVRHGDARPAHESSTPATSGH
ncbi:MAG TPA: cytochrome C oxidase subunit IV family protein [Pirellulales bacterium]|nr:cytochrome C oxidase subunit IV family protein [Pirellulales bacterium]